MRIADRKTLPWFLGSTLAFAAAAAIYFHYVYTHPTGMHGGSWPGLAYGSLGSLLILFALLLNLRKQLRTVRIGRAYLWMQGHVWLGALSYPLVLFHAGLRWGGPLTQVLMWIFTLVVLTGVVGLALQQYIPGKLKREVPRETVMGQIEHVMDQLSLEASALMSTVNRATATETADADASRALSAYYEWDVVPLLSRKTMPRLSRSAWSMFHARYLKVRADFPAPWLNQIDALHDIVKERAQLETQRRLHRLLHGWLFVHAPLSYALIAVVLIHVFYALKYARLGGW